MWTRLEKIGLLLTLFGFFGFGTFYDLFDSKKWDRLQNPLGVPTTLEDKSSDEIRKEQSALRKQLHDLQEQLSTRRPEPVQRLERKSNSADLRGVWTQASGGRWEIQQWASNILVQEFYPLWGLIAIGEGTVRKRNVRINYVSLLGVPGTAFLTLSEDDRTLEGHAKDAISQSSNYIKVSRQGQSW
jgi:hypothetical protein